MRGRRLLVAIVAAFALTGAATAQAAPLLSLPAPLTRLAPSVQTVVNQQFPAVVNQLAVIGSCQVVNPGLSTCGAPPATCSNQSTIGAFVSRTVGCTLAAGAATLSCGVGYRVGGTGTETFSTYGGTCLLTLVGGSTLPVECSESTFTSGVGGFADWHRDCYVGTVAFSEDSVTADFYPPNTAMALAVGPYSYVCTTHTTTYAIPDGCVLHTS